MTRPVRLPQIPQYNIIPACKSCNASKRNKNMDDWYAAHENYSQENFIKIKNFLNKGDENGRII